MFNIFKKQKGEVKNAGKETAVAAEAVTGETTGAETEEEISTTLSYHPDMKVGQEESYYFSFLNNELPPLKPNQLSLSGIELRKEEQQVVVTAFIRNSLNRTIKLEDTPLLLLGTNEEILGRKVFPLAEAGDIPARSSRPWMFTFNESDLLAEEFPQTGWSLAFELKQPHQLDLDESWKNGLPQAEQASLDKLVKQMDPPKEGEVNFMGLQAKRREDGSLHVTMLIRNGSDHNVQLQQLPLAVEDASGDVICKGSFTLDDLEVKANTSKPWTFIFPAELILKESLDLSSWKAYPPNN